MLTREYIYGMIIQFAALRKEIELSDEMGIFSDLQYDSLKFFELIAEVENLTGKELSDIDGLMEAVKTVGSLTEYIMRQVN